MKKIEVKNEEISQGLLKHQTSSWKKNRAKKHLPVHSESYKNSLERKVENSVFKKHIEIIETSVEGGKKYKWRCRICHANGKELILQENREGSSNFSKHFLGKSHKKKEIKLCESVQEQRIFKINVVSLGEKKTIFCDCGIQAIKCNNQTGVFFGCGKLNQISSSEPKCSFQYFDRVSPPGNFVDDYKLPPNNQLGTSFAALTNGMLQIVGSDGKKL